MESTGIISAILAFYLIFICIIIFFASYNALKGLSRLIVHLTGKAQHYVTHHDDGWLARKFPYNPSAARFEVIQGIIGFILAHILIIPLPQLGGDLTFFKKFILGILILKSLMSFFVFFAESYLTRKLSEEGSWAARVFGPYSRFWLGEWKSRYFYLFLGLLFSVCAILFWQYIL